MVTQGADKKKTKSRSPENKETSGHRFARKDLIWGAVCVFVGFWMFGLGILVGRGNAPVAFDTQALQKELSALKQAAVVKTMKRYEADSQKSDERTSLAFYEELKRSRDAAAPTGDAVSPSQPSPLAADAVPVIPMKLKGEMFKKPATQPGVWTVQVAASKDSADADRIVARLKKQGYPAYRLARKIDGKGTWHRVRVGKYQRRTDVEAIIDRLKKDRYSPMLVKGLGN